MSTSPPSMIRRHKGAIFVPARWLERRIGLYPADVIKDTNQAHRLHPAPPPDHVQITKKAALALIRLGMLDLETRIDQESLTLRERTIG